MKEYLSLFFALVVAAGCTQPKTPELTPWGTPVDETEAQQADTSQHTGRFALADVIEAGEIIMLTMSGPATYYDYHGRGMGTEYLLAEQFAQRLGVTLRVEVCRDTAEMISRLQQGEGDLIAFQLPRKATSGLRFCGAQEEKDATQWAVSTDNGELADTLNAWFRPEMVAKVQQRERFLLSAQSITRRVYSPMLSRQKGIISSYDHYFQAYAATARIDWRMMAAQCYQESCFDPNARSWAGARGLMQIMPATAAHLGLAMADIHNPQANIEASARYMGQLSKLFADIANPLERSYFALAAYNGGYNHVRDAMALAQADGRRTQVWDEVAPYVLRLQQPAYYTHRLVKYGYMRGSETVDYVARIRQRWNQYRGVVGGAGIDFGGGPSQIPHKARHKNKYKI